MSEQSNGQPAATQVQSLQPRLMTLVGEYIHQEWDGFNESQLIPIGDSFLVLIDVCPERLSSGIYLDQEQQSRITEACESGRIVAIGDGAWVWTADRSRKFEGRKPKVGELVTFERYSGGSHIRFGKQYRYMTDKALSCIVDETQGTGTADGNEQT